jgi:hypothetical protein
MNKMITIGFLIASAISCGDNSGFYTDGGAPIHLDASLRPASDAGSVGVDPSDASTPIDVRADSGCIDSGIPDAVASDAGRPTDSCQIELKRSGGLTTVTLTATCDPPQSVDGEITVLSVDGTNLLGFPIHSLACPGGRDTVGFAANFALAPPSASIFTQGGQIDCALVAPSPLASNHP